MGYYYGKGSKTGDVNLGDTFKAKAGIDGLGAAGAAGASGGTDCHATRQACVQGCEETFDSVGRKGRFAERRYQLCLERCDLAFDNCMTKGGGCVDDSDCPSGQKCVSGKCQGETTDTGCPPESKNNAGAYEGCPCGWKFPAPASGTCPSGYALVKNADGTPENSTVGEYSGPICGCLKWCADHGRSGTDCSVGAGGGAGEFNFPPEIMELLRLLLGRATDVLNMPYGISPQAQAYMFGRDFEKIRGQEAGQRESMFNTLSRTGRLGTGTATNQLNKLAWGTEETISNLMRDILVESEKQKKQDTINFTTLAQSLLGSGMNVYQLVEAINAARRGESQAAMELLLRILQMNQQG